MTQITTIEYSPYIPQQDSIDDIGNSQEYDIGNSQEYDIEKNILYKLETRVIVKLNETILQIHNRLNKNNEEIKKLNITVIVILKYIVIGCVISTGLFIYLYARVFA